MDLSQLLLTPYETEIVGIFTILFLSLVGLIIRVTLVMTGQTWAGTYHYLATYILLPNIAYVITTTIANNIALSLGMIGALSIVRFRHPVRSPFELTIYFALITIGIAASVQIKYSYLLVSLIVITLVGITFFQTLAKKFGFSIYKLSFNEGVANNIVEISSSEKIENIAQNSNLLSYYYANDTKICEYKLAFKNKSDLDIFLKEISENKKIVTCRTSINT